MTRFIIAAISLCASLFSLCVMLFVIYGAASIGASVYKANSDCSKTYQIERYVHGNLFCEESK